MDEPLDLPALRRFVNLAGFQLDDAELAAILPAAQASRRLLAALAEAAADIEPAVQYRIL